MRVRVCVCVSLFVCKAGFCLCQRLVCALGIQCLFTFHHYQWPSPSTHDFCILYLRLILPFMFFTIFPLPEPSFLPSSALLPSQALVPSSSDIASEGTQTMIVMYKHALSKWTVCSLQVRRENRGRRKICLSCPNIHAHIWIVDPLDI